MPSPYVFSNYALQFLKSNVATRFRVYAAAYNPVQIQCVSQDVQTDQYGQYTNISNVDLLATQQPPFMPQANFGPNRVGFANEGLFFDGSRSTQRNNLAAIGHTWAATGNPTITTYNNLGQGDQAMIAWANPGIYTVSLTVSDRFGNSMTGTRQVYVYQDRNSTPQGVISLSGLTGSIDSGGWQGQFTITQQAFRVLLPEALPPGYYQPIVLMAETEYEVAPGYWVAAQIGQYGAPVPGQFYDDPRIIFSGYVQAGTATQDNDHDTVSVTLQTVDMVMRQAGIHNIGFYNTTYSGRVNGTPTTQNASGVGKGQNVADLTSEDIYRSLVTGWVDSGGAFHGGHSNIGQYHDLVIWRDYLPIDSVSSGLQYLTYSNLTANEGTVWDACNTLAANEFANIWCQRDGSICIGPTYSMRGYELMNQPTNNSYLALSNILSAGELNGDTTKGARLAFLLNLFGCNPLPVAKDLPWQTPRDLSQLIGPPIVGHFSDVPIYDTGQSSSASGLFPWTSANWPQDLSIRPLSTNVAENYTNRAAFVKLVATVANAQAVWAAWYPTNTFDATGLMKLNVPAGAWTVQDNFLLADATIANGKNAGYSLSWVYLWEMARRIYLASNAQYTVSMELGMANWLRLHDTFLFTRQNAQDGPKLRNAPFYVTDITFNINLDQQQWTTSVKAMPVTSFGIGPVIVPPYPAPVINSTQPFV